MAAGRAQGKAARPALSDTEIDSVVDALLARLAKQGGQRTKGGLIVPGKRGMGAPTTDTTAGADVDSGVALMLYNSATYNRAREVTAVADGANGTGRMLVVPSMFNGTTYDRPRNNIDLTVLASAARTASVDSADQTNYNGRGLHLVIDVTAIAATPSLVFTIQGKDILSGKYYTLLVSAAIVAVGTTVLRVYPGLVVAANLAANDVLPRVWRVSVAAGDADSITYSVGASVIF